MKIVCSDQIDVCAPAERIFEVLCDVTKWPAWFGCVVSAQQPDQRALALGEEIRMCLHAGRRRWQEAFEVTRFVRNAFLSLEGTYSAARRIDFRLEQRSHLTRVGCIIGYRAFGGALGAALDAVVRRRRISRMVSDSLMHLKTLVEDPAELALPDWRTEAGSAAFPIARAGEPVTVG